MRSLWVPVRLWLSSFSQTFENPRTLILYVGVAGNLGLSAGNSGLLGSFSEATTIDFKICFSFLDKAMPSIEKQNHYINVIFQAHKTIFFNVLLLFLFQRHSRPQCPVIRRSVSAKNIVRGLVLAEIGVMHV